MLATVFTSCYNQCKHLPYAIESVLAQSCSDFEYLLFNDGSTDDTLDIMLDYADKDKRIRVFDIPKQKNVGVVINRSIHEANGDYWVWCPSDDILMSDLLKIKSKVARKYPDYVLYDNWDIIDEKGINIGSVDIAPMTPKEFSAEVWRSSPIGFTGIWIPIDVLQAIPFPTHLAYSEDFYWMIKATIHCVDFLGIQERLHLKRRHINTNTSKNIDAILAQIHTIREDLRNYKE